MIGWRFLACVSGLCALSVGANAASTDAAATATVLSDTLAARCSPLSFGTLVSGRWAGAVTVTPNNQRITAGLIQMEQGGYQNGLCDVRGRANRLYSISVPSQVTFTVQPKDGVYIPGLQRELRASLFQVQSQNLFLPLWGRLNRAGQDTLRVGGTLFIPGNAHPGLYRGIVPVTVEY